MSSAPIMHRFLPDLTDLLDSFGLWASHVQTFAGARKIHHDFVIKFSMNFPVGIQLKKLLERCVSQINPDLASC